MTPIPKTFKYWKKKEQEAELSGDPIRASYCKGMAEGVAFVSIQLKNILNESEDVNLVVPNVMCLVEGTKEYFNRKVKFDDEDQKLLF